MGAPDATNDNTLFTTTRFFSAPLAQTAYLRRHLNQLLGDLLERLKSFGQGCICIEIRLHLDNRTEQTISLAVEKPSASVRLFLRQWQTQSETLRLDSGISGVTVTIPHLRPLLIEQTALATHRELSTAPMALPDSVHYPQLRLEVLPESCFELTKKKMSGFSSRRGGTSEPDLQDSRRTRCDLTRSEAGRERHQTQLCDADVPVRATTRRAQTPRSCHDQDEERLLRSREARDTRNDRSVEDKTKMSKPRQPAADDHAYSVTRDFDLQDSQQRMKSPQRLHSVVARSDFTLSLSKGPSRRSNLNHQRRWQSVGLRLLQPPRPVRIQTHHNQPIDFTWAGRHRTIIGAAGPWELSGQWWQSGFHRRYYEIIIDTCQRYLVFCDETDPRWFVQGVFD